MTRQLYSCLCLLLLVLTGCFKDKGNYDLHPINELTITSTTPDTILVNQFDRIKMQVEIAQTMPSGDYNYRWTVYPYINAGSVNDTLGLSTAIDTVVKVNPGDYTLLFAATEKKTGISTFKKFFMRVSSIYSEGWIVLDGEGGDQQLSLIRPDGSVMRNVYQTANGEKLPANSFRVRVLNVYIGDQDIFLISKDGGVSMDYISFKKQLNYPNWFFKAPDTIAPANIFYNKLGVAGFVINNGKVHYLPFSYQGPRRYGAPLEGDYVISPYVFPMMSSDNAIFFDTKYRRFLSHANGKLTPLISPAGSAFDLANVGKTLVYAGESNNDFHNCLFKDLTADKFYVYRLNTAATNMAAEKYDVVDAPEIKDARLFASSGIYLQIYYAVGNKVYLLDIPAQKARLVYTFPAGTQITAMRLKMSTSLLISYPDNNRVITFGTLENNEGKVYSFSISNTGDFVNNTFTKVYTGFKKVVDLEYKNRK
ncbi:PKD-like family protein [Chitinophaga jiangningensis]|uniref:PKD-like family protein n=1 Tax=Chitinophaga jiangningensis TaxID=1419482 RepID=A0A1M7FHY4_9BACT|nr:PKD-like family lipoprotein [Chitinophaga jiangningensis]SHM03674.1 PKD-like family protein [Chitinophaga jiangningensis]